MPGVGDGLSVKRAAWSFGDGVADSFDEHVSKSVPLYHEGHDLICDLSDFFVKNDSVSYEIGCSTGTLTLRLAAHNKEKKSAKFVGIDIENEMIEKAKLKLKELSDIKVDFVEDDVLTMEMEAADLIVCYYTIQFVHPSVRQKLFDKIYRHLNWGGALLLFEKVRGADARFQDIMTSIYQDFKVRNGYTADEILAKSQSLKGVLEPFSTHANIELMRRAGFEDINTIQKYVCFEGFLAIK